MFKPGDVVRPNSDNVKFLDDREYVVKSIKGDLLSFDNLGNWWYTHRFELVRSAPTSDRKFKPGDTVRWKKGMAPENHIEKLGHGPFKVKEIVGIAFGYDYIHLEGVSNADNGWHVNRFELVEQPVADEPIAKTTNWKQQDYLDYVSEKLNAIEELIHAKNTDYAASDDPFANFRLSEGIGINPIQGIYLRMQDKHQRIKAFFRNGSLAVKSEGVEDAFCDLIGYSLLALGMLQEAKDKESEAQDVEDARNSVHSDPLQEAE